MKSEVYSWRLSSDLKCELEEEARRERVSVSQLLERIVREWLKTRSTAAEADGGARAAARTRDAPLRHAAQRDPDLSEKLSERVREGILRARMRAQGLIDTGAMLALLIRTIAGMRGASRPSADFAFRGPPQSPS